MNRRGFISSLMGAAAGFALDPERLLWVPGARKFFLPSVQEFTEADFIGYRAGLSVDTKEPLRFGETWIFPMEPLGKPRRWIITVD